MFFELPPTVRTFLAVCVSGVPGHVFFELPPTVGTFLGGSCPDTCPAIFWPVLRVAADGRDVFACRVSASGVVYYYTQDFLFFLDLEISWFRKSGFLTNADFMAEIGLLGEGCEWPRTEPLRPSAPSLGRSAVTLRARDVDASWSYYIHMFFSSWT